MNNSEHEFGLIMKLKATIRHLDSIGNAELSTEERGRTLEVLQTLAKDTKNKDLLKILDGTNLLDGGEDSGEVE
ncbi:MAG TPA: hypothetical protein VMR59_00985 [Patescibacteria group bacterium]|nr:hypothetical protein [Patescibacteria group bacterium]